VLLSDYGKGGLAPHRAMIELAPPGRPVLVDPKGDDYSRYAGATLVTPNRAELRGVVGRWASEAASSSLPRRLRTRLGAGDPADAQRGRDDALHDGPSWTVPAQARRCTTSAAPGDR